MSNYTDWPDELSHALMVPAALFDEEPHSNLASFEKASAAFRNQLTKATAKQVEAIALELVRMYERERIRELYQRWHDDGIALKELRQRLEEHFTRWCP